MSASRSVSSSLRSNLGDTVSAIAVATASAASAALRAAAARVWTDLRAVTESVTPVTLTGSKRWSSRFEGFPGRFAALVDGGEGGTDGAAISRTNTGISVTINGPVNIKGAYNPPPTGVSEN